MVYRKSMTSRHWCFTIYDKHGSDPTALEVWSKTRYMVYQHEVCPATERHHIQGYIELCSPQRLSALLKVCPAHWERRRGTADEARDYCMKQETRQSDTTSTEWGVFGGCQGRRLDLKHIKDILDDGGSILECFDDDFATTVRYEKSFRSYASLIAGVRDWMPEVELYWGKPRTGKSRKAHQDHPDAYRHDGSQWWDGYDGQDTVIFDDFSGTIPLNTLLKICDRYPMSVPIKGGYVPLLVKYIIFTSNIPLEDWYPNVQDIRREALRRRFSKIIFYGI